MSASGKHNSLVPSHGAASASTLEAAPNTPRREILLVSDFDQTLSFNDSGILLCEMLGLGGFEHRVAGLSRIHLIQQGGELHYLLLHDPEFRRVRKEHLVAVGRRIRLKANIGLLLELLAQIPDYHFSFHVVSSAPEEVIQAALAGIVPAENIHGTQYRYDPATGEIESLVRVPAGYGKVAVVEALRAQLELSHDRIVYVGDGSSDVHVMLHVNRLDGLTIAVSENESVAQIARRTVLSEDALGMLIPILQEIVGWNSLQIRTFFASSGLVLQDWDRVRTDSLTIRNAAPPTEPALAGGN